MLGAIDGGGVGGYILKHFRVVDVLLCIGADEVVIREARDGEHRRAVELCIVEAGQKVGAAGPSRRQTDAELAGPLRVADRHERRRFLNGAPGQTELCPVVSAALP